jgi:DNA-binding transcriptional LysR family regulator
VPDWSFRIGKRWISVRPEGRLSSDSGEAILQWAVAGLGIAELPSFMVSDAIRSGALEPLLLDHPAPEHGLHVVRPPGAYVPGKVRVLTDALVQRFGGEPDWDGCQMAVRELARRAQDAPTHRSSVSVPA